MQTPAHNLAGDTLITVSHQTIRLAPENSLKSVQQEVSRGTAFHLSKGKRSWLSVSLVLGLGCVAATCFCVIGTGVVVACADLSSVRLIGSCMIFAGVHSAGRWRFVASARVSGLARLLVSGDVR